MTWRDGPFLMSFQLNFLSLLWVPAYYPPFTSISISFTPNVIFWIPDNCKHPYSAGLSISRLSQWHVFLSARNFDDLRLAALEAHPIWTGALERVTLLLLLPPRFHLQSNPQTRRVYSLCLLFTLCIAFKLYPYLQALGCDIGLSSSQMAPELCKISELKYPGVNLS